MDTVQIVAFVFISFAVFSDAKTALTISAVVWFVLSLLDWEPTKRSKHNDH